MRHNRDTVNNYFVKIKDSDDLTKRAFISISINGKRIKEYTGAKLGLNIKPNSALSIEHRSSLLKELEYEFKKSLEFNTYPLDKQEYKHPAVIKTPSLQELLDRAISNKKKANLSIKYVKHLESLTIKFKSFLCTEELEGNINSLERARIQEFMNLFNTSASHYMIARRHIKAVFSEIDKDFEFNTTIVNRTDRRKATPKLHKTYTDEQRNNVLDFLKNNHFELYLCCLLSYGCLLRPHNEIRLLKRHHFKNNISEIHLSGNENKGKKIRVVPIPTYVRDIFLPRIENLQPDDNIFTGKTESNNLYYFSTAWTRMFKIMANIGIIEKNQTIYSFRHTASVNVYKKTKDLHILQQLLGHSDMIVTLKYLRGLGVHNAEELRHVMPEL